MKTAAKFFAQSKALKTVTAAQTKQILNMQVSYCCDVPSVTKAIYVSAEESPTIYVQHFESRAADIKKSGKSVVYIGSNFVFGIMAEASSLDFKGLEEAVKVQPKEGEAPKKAAKVVVKNKAGKKKDVVECCSFKYISTIDQQKVLDFFKAQEFTHIEL